MINAKSTSVSQSARYKQKPRGPDDAKPNVTQQTCLLILLQQTDSKFCFRPAVVEMQAQFQRNASILKFSYSNDLCGDILTQRLDIYHNGVKSDTKYP